MLRSFRFTAENQLVNSGRQVHEPCILLSNLDGFGDIVCEFVCALADDWNVINPADGLATKGPAVAGIDRLFRYLRELVGERVNHKLKTIGYAELGIN